MKNPSDALPQRMLVLARITPGEPATLTELVRRRRQIAGLNGTLLFDGERVAEVLSGPGEMLDAAWADLCEDPGFRLHIRVLRKPALPAEVAPGWRYGYCDAVDLDPVFAHAPTEMALESLTGVAGRVDLSA